MNNKSIAAEQVTQEARKQFENNKKALKLTSIIVAVLIRCYVPLVISRILYQSAMSVITTHMLILTAVSVVLLNSVLNPIIYAVRIREFRLAYSELACRTVDTAEAEEIN